MYGREELEFFNVPASDFESRDFEQIEVEAYIKSEADSVMDAMEARIKELEAENARLKKEVSNG